MSICRITCNVALWMGIVSRYLNSASKCIFRRRASSNSFSPANIFCSSINGWLISWLLSLLKQVCVFLFSVRFGSVLSEKAEKKLKKAEKVKKAKKKAKRFFFNHKRYKIL